MVDKADTVDTTDGWQGVVLCYQEYPGCYDQTYRVKTSCEEEGCAELARVRRPRLHLTESGCPCKCLYFLDEEADQQSAVVLFDPI